MVSLSIFEATCTHNSSSCNGDELESVAPEKGAASMAKHEVVVPKLKENNPASITSSLVAPAGTEVADRMPTPPACTH